MKSLTLILLCLSLSSCMENYSPKKMDLPEAKQVVQQFLEDKCDSYQLNPEKKEINCFVTGVINESCARIVVPKEECKVKQGYYQEEQEDALVKKVCDRFRSYTMTIIPKKITHIELQEGSPMLSPFRDMNDRFIVIYHGADGAPFFHVESYFNHHYLADALYTIAKEGEGK